MNLGKIKFLFVLLVLSVLFSTLTFSQDVGKTDGSDIVGLIVAIIPIVIVVLILLYLAGLLRFKKIGINWAFVFYFILIVVIFVLPLLQRFGMIHIFPDNPEELFKREEFSGFKLNPLPKAVCNVFKSLNVSESVACYMPAFLYFFILPFTAIFAITWAFLKQIKIFEGIEKNLEALIAFIIAFMTLPMGTFILLVALWFSVAGAFSVAIFIAMFLAGVFFRGYGFVTAEAYSAGLRLQAQKSQALLRKIEALLDEFDRLSLDSLKDSLKELRDAYRDVDAIVSVFPTKSDIDGIQRKEDMKSKLEEIRKKLKS